MTAADDLVLVATDPTSGATRISSTSADAVIGGAFLFDLVNLGRLGFEVPPGKPSRKGKVVVLDHAAVDDGVLEHAFSRLRNRGRLAPQSAVTRLGKGGVRIVQAELVRQGVLRKREARFLWIFPLTRHDVIDVARRESLVHRVREVLVHDAEPDAETGPLVGLLAAGDLLKLVVDKPDRKRAKARAKVVAEGDWASEGVRKAIEAANTAMIVAVTAATTAAASGSS